MLKTEQSSPCGLPYADYHQFAAILAWGRRKPLALR